MNIIKRISAFLSSNFEELLDKSIEVMEEKTFESTEAMGANKMHVQMEREALRHIKELKNLLRDASLYIMTDPESETLGVVRPDKHSMELGPEEIEEAVRQFLYMNDYIEDDTKVDLNVVLTNEGLKAYVIPIQEH